LGQTQKQPAGNQELSQIFSLDNVPKTRDFNCKAGRYLINIPNMKTTWRFFLITGSVLAWLPLLLAAEPQPATPATDSKTTESIDLPHKEASAAQKSIPPKPASHTVRMIEGWTVRVDDRLLTPPNEDLGLRALKLLAAKLNDITYVVPQDRLIKLQSIPIILDLNHGSLHAMQYHPSAEWLEAHGFSRDLARCVHICEAADFARARQVHEQPWVVLHELAHAYHDQVLGFDEPRILLAYEEFKKSGHGDATLLFNGQKTRHYALTDHKEFFAEMTEAYFGMNDFFPFNRAELMTAEPQIYALMKNVWEEDKLVYKPMTPK
jgi:hypothetical protein